jgi:hypothetical protein
VVLARLLLLDGAPVRNLVLLHHTIVVFVCFVQVEIRVTLICRDKQFLGDVGRQLLFGDV